ncbi:hypothetical protein P9411_23030, partial [Escherichia coli]|uniref:hypothetical protein n=1 Tax=Escherichia coli TaxID=562 RepID=UPI00398B1FCA
YYVPFRAIFADEKIESAVGKVQQSDWQQRVIDLPDLRLAIAAGVLIKGSASSVDLLLVGDIPASRVKNVVKEIEKIESRELN